MTDRVQTLVDAGRLDRLAASDEEIAGYWNHAVEDAIDARHGLSARGRFTRAYDAARIAALAIVRSRDLRVRAENHHEVTFATAAELTAGELPRLIERMNRLRPRRHTAEYGWQQREWDADAAEATDLAWRILRLAGEHLREERKALAARLTLPPDPSGRLI